MMGVSRSGYYKHLKLLESGQLRSEKLYQAISQVSIVHQSHPSHGYRWVAAYIRRNTDYSFSDGLIYKAFRYLGITSKTRHKRRYKPRKIKDKYPNLIFATWEKVDRPRQVIVSDMTSFHAGDRYYELTLYFDVFTKQILSWRLSNRRGDREPYLFGLLDVIELLEFEGSDSEPVYLHTDQGSVYASMAYNDLVQNTSIIRSMSRAGKPTDNPVNESLNGWIKEELFSDFHLGRYDERYWVYCAIEEYVDYYNEQRPSYSLGYETPNDYYRRYLNGDLERKYTFENRFDESSDDREF